MGKKLEDIEVVLLHETEKAWLVRSVNTGVPAWVPKSWGQIEPQHYDPPCDAVLTIPHEYALDKELI